MPTVERGRVVDALPDYTVGRELGVGGFGVVLAGHHRELDRDVAIKILSVTTTGGSGAVEDFRTEARLLNRLDHPHIVRVYDFVAEGEVCLLVMELLAGGSLSRQHLTGDSACAVVLAMAEALEHAHGLGMLHQDIKPENILFTTGGQPKLTDFGIARIFDGEADAASGVVGTPRYMAPEQITGGRLGPPADLYALGAVLYELISGVPLFPPTLSVPELLRAHCETVPPMPVGVPEPIGRVMMRALAKDPGARQQSAREFARELISAARSAYGPRWINSSGIVVHAADDVEVPSSWALASGYAAPSAARAAASAASAAAGPGAAPVDPAADVTEIARPVAAAGTAGAAGAAGAAGLAAPTRPGEAGALADDATVLGNPTLAALGPVDEPATAALSLPGGPPAGAARPPSGRPHPVGHQPEATGRMGGAPGRGGRQVGLGDLFRPGEAATASSDETGLTDLVTSGASALGVDGQNGSGSNGHRGSGYGAAGAGAGAAPGLGRGGRFGRSAAGGRARSRRRLALIAAACVVVIVAVATTLVVAGGSSGGPPPVIDIAARPLPPSNSPQVDTQPATKIATVAGTGVNAATGDGTMAQTAGLARPYSATIDWFGNLYYADFGSNRIRVINPCGVITTVAGRGLPGFSGDGGPASQAELMSPSAAASDLRGNVYISDTFNHRIRKVDPHGVITTVAGMNDRGYNGDNKPATQATLWYPAGIAVDTRGDVFIADLGNNRVRKVTPDGMITTLAGEGDQGSAGDGGPATKALLDGPFGVAVDRAGNVYIADTDNQRIRKIDTRGIITTVAGDGRIGFAGDGGPATKASLNQPRGIAVDEAGNLYITDKGNDRIRRVDPHGIITTLAGDGVVGFAGDSGPAGRAKLDNPDGSVGIDTEGNVFIADRGSNRIRAVSRADRHNPTLTCPNTTPVRPGAASAAR